MFKYLKSVALAGYRSYSNSLALNKLDLNHINILIGANGAGKSNLISFLEMVSYMMTGGLRNYISKQGGAQSALYFGPKNTDRISGELVIIDEDGEKEDTYSFSLELSATNQLFFSEEKMLYKSRGHFIPYSKDFGVGHVESNLIDSNEPTIKILRTYLERLRVFHFNDTSISSRIRSSTYLDDNRYLRSDGGNLGAFLFRMKNTPNELDYYQRIVRHIRNVIPQFFDFSLEPNFDGTNINMNWRPAGSEEIFGPHQLSDGALRYIALTTLLLQPSWSAPMTIILDEPEIGLHPYAISELAKEIRLASKTSQIIVSTQSPLLLNEFSCEDIVTVEYDAQEQRSTMHRHSEEELKSWLEAYSLGELWEKNVLGGLPL